VPNSGLGFGVLGIKLYLPQQQTVF
jgi:hypothetical protein